MKEGSRQCEAGRAGHRWAGGGGSSRMCVQREGAGGRQRAMKAWWGPRWGAWRGVNGPVLRWAKGNGRRCG